MKQHFNIPIFIPHLGCNNSCVFCNQHSITGTKKRVECEEVESIIREHLKYKGEKEAEIAFFGGSFTGLDLSEQEEYLALANRYLKSGQVSGIRVSTRPDYISEPILELLMKYGVTTVELGAQSMCDDVLMLSKRGHTAKDTCMAAEMIKQSGIKLGLQMMVGLPGDCEEKTVYTAREIVRLGADMARVYPTVVLYDTELYNMYKSGLYKPLSVEDAVAWSAKAVAVLENGGTSVIRIGLQETETLGDGVAGGAYHPAIGDMVRARIMRNVLEEYIQKNKPSVLEISADKKAVSHITGHKRENIIYITDTYKIPVKIKVVSDGFYINGEKVFFGKEDKNE